jgi:hypothetical protein
MKKIIKLNESQLLNVINETVKAVISEMDELDWKTYASAANKAYQKGDKRYEKFQKAAEDEFNKQYGRDRGDFDNHEQIKLNANPLGGGVSASQKTTTNPGGRFNRDSTDNIAYRLGRSQVAKADRFSDKWGNDTTTYNNGGNPERYTNHFNDEFATAYKKADDEAENFYNGKYAYDKQKGWQLRESIDKAVNEALNTFLAK